jgi:hypothetical protein
MIHVNTLVTDAERKEFLVDYITKSDAIAFVNEKETRFPADRPDFMIKFLVEKELIEEAKDKILADYNAWVRETIDAKKTNEETTGNVFVIFSFSHSEENYKVANVKIIQ